MSRLLLLPLPACLALLPQDPGPTSHAEQSLLSLVISCPTYSAIRCDHLILLREALTPTYAAYLHANVCVKHLEAQKSSPFGLLGPDQFV